MRVGRKEGIAIGRKKEDAKTILESRSAIKVLGMSPDIIGTSFTVDKMTGSLGEVTIET